MGAEADDYRYAVVDRKAGRVTGLHETYREAIGEAMVKVRGW